MNQPTDEQTDQAVLGLVAWARKHAKAMGLTGVILVALVSALVTTLATNVAAPAAGIDTQPLTAQPTPVNIVAASGLGGFPVEEFCNDALTKVTKDFVAPPESTFAATYNLNRTVGSVHEAVFVGVYADPNRQPAATHYDSANTPSDAFVSKKALECIVKKAK